MTTPTTNPLDDRPAIVLARATRGDPERLRLVTALATAVEGPERRPGPGWLAALMAAAVLFAALAG